MPELLKRLSPVARKPHLCNCCGSMAVSPGERYDRSTYVDDGRVYDWVSCLPCKRLAPVVFLWSIDGDEGIGPDEYREWASEMANDAVHGEDARAWLFRAGMSIPHPTTRETPHVAQLHQHDALFDITPNNETKTAALADSITQKDAEVKL